MNGSKPVCVLTCEHGSDLYRKSVDLRDRVLRRPLGLSFSVDSLDREDRDIHCAATDSSGRVLGCLVLSKADGSTFRMRQVAVEPAMQSSGIGTSLVAFSEEICRFQQMNRILLHAREEAIPFYLRLGYRTVGPPFYEVSLPHMRMEKVIPDHAKK